ncbi:MAG TPA: hypothetical protein VKQ72_17105, partial [Aggregatilineales bacterium]|nr:hypothetical protein [Aggregatilineales bacterium]
QVLYTNRDYEDAIVEFKTCQKQQKSDNIPPDTRLTECWYLQGLADFLLGACDQAMPIFNDLLTWTHDATAIRFTNTGINKCALAYSGQYLTPTPIPPTNTPPPPIQ